MPNESTPDIIVIGASAGGVIALREIVQALPADFPAAVFIVLHLSRHSPSSLGPLLARVSSVRVGTAQDGDPIAPGIVYVAPPDLHMTVEPSRVRVCYGPLQNRARPSIDVLFRSAALAFGPRVIGVVLTGLLSDGTAGLLAIKQHGGTTVVEDPESALYEDMPRNALRNVPVDHCVSLQGLAQRLIELVATARRPDRTDKERTVMTAAAAAVHRFETDADLGKVGPLEQVAQPSSFLCPDCGGALWELREGELPRYRCRTGHSYAAENLMAGQDSSVERALWAAARSLEDRAALAHHLAQQWHGRGAPQVLEHFRDQVQQSGNHAATIRAMLGVDESKPSR